MAEKRSTLHTSTQRAPQANAGRCISHRTALPFPKQNLEGNNEEAQATPHSPMTKVKKPVSPSKIPNLQLPRSPISNSRFCIPNYLEADFLIQNS